MTDTWTHTTHGVPTHIEVDAPGATRVTYGVRELVPVGGGRYVLSDPNVTPTDEQDPVPAEEETPVEDETDDTAEVGAWMGEKEQEPSETPDPEW